MLEVLGLTKYYGSSPACVDLNFNVKPGEILAFLGPNGAGKTTTMRMLATLIAPSWGAATVAGFDICSAASEVRQRIGYLPEYPPLYGELRVSEFLRYFAELRGVSRAQVKDRVEEVMSLTGLASVSMKLCGTLSRGYRQRVGLAQALVHQPEVLILDEPTTGLDPKQIIEIRELISGLRAGHTVLLSTHLLAEATAIADRAVIISNGKIVFNEPTASFAGAHSLEEIFLDRINFQTAVGES